MTEQVAEPIKRRENQGQKRLPIKLIAKNQRMQG